MFLDCHPSLRLQFDEELKLLRTYWLSPWLPASEYCATMMALLRVAQQAGPRLCLFDYTNTPPMSVDDQIWLGRHYVPDAARIPVERVVLLVGQLGHYDQLAIESLIALGRPLVMPDIQYFTDLHPALSWLTDDSPRLPELLAEWEAAPTQA